VVVPLDATGPTARYAESPLKEKLAPYVPLCAAGKVHVYVETLATDVGSLATAQVVMPGTPVIAHVAPPDGGFAPAGPVTVAVNVIVDPKEAVVEFGVTTTVGEVLPTVVVAPEVSADA